MCKAEVSIGINEHKNCYKSVSELIAERLENEIIDSDDIDQNILAVMIKRDFMVNIHFYPDTPVGFISFYHYDIDCALDLALSYFGERGESMNIEEKIKEGYPVISLHDNDESVFDRRAKVLYRNGYALHSSGCGFVNSEAYDFEGSYRGIFVKPRVDVRSVKDFIGGEG